MMFSFSFCVLRCNIVDSVVPIIFCTVSDPFVQAVFDRSKRSKQGTVEKLRVAVKVSSQSDRYRSRYGRNESGVEISAGRRPDGGPLRRGRHRVDVRPKFQPRIRFVGTDQPTIEQGREVGWGAGVGIERGLLAVATLWRLDGCRSVVVRRS